jgi:hypothetical protein
MTDSTAADRLAWRASADYRDEETRSDALARARAAERNAGWIFLPVRPFTAATVILLNMLVIYGITVHGSREGTRFYTDRA